VRTGTVIGLRSVVTLVASVQLSHGLCELAMFLRSVELSHSLCVNWHCFCALLSCHTGCFRSVVTQVVCELALFLRSVELSHWLFPFSCRTDCV
jgi:hypothetical protein